MPPDFSLTTYDYTLPPDLIAQEAVSPADSARLLVSDRISGTVLGEATYADLPSLVPQDRVFFFNNSRVIRSRIPLTSAMIIAPDGKEKSGVKGEIFYLRSLDQDTFEALVRPGRTFRIGTKVRLGSTLFEVTSVSPDGRIFRILSGSLEDVMETYGELPLPPYIAYNKEKEKDYQSVFASTPGSVAAPTASLHFTTDLLGGLPHRKEFITLHVGLGTFRGIDTGDVRDYAIHGETVEVEKSLFSRIAIMKRNGQKVLAVGTTVCRTLESLPFLWRSLPELEKESFSQEVRDFWGARASITDDRAREDGFISRIEIRENTLLFETHIYIFPGYTFRLVDELITNFHLPKSSLLVLVSAFSTLENIRKLYQHAITQQYRFYSFGDGMYLERGSITD